MWFVLLFNKVYMFDMRKIFLDKMLCFFYLLKLSVAQKNLKSDFKYSLINYSQ